GGICRILTEAEDRLQRAGRRNISRIDVGAQIDRNDAARRSRGGGKSPADRSQQDGQRQKSHFHLAPRINIDVVSRDTRILPAHPGPEKDDSPWQVSWLGGSSPLSAFPPVKAVANKKEARRLQLRGQPRFRAIGAVAFPFNSGLAAGAP